MELKLTVDTDDLYDEDGMNFEGLLSESLRRQILKDCGDSFGSEKFKEFARLTSDTIIAGVKLKMQNFLSEEIALTDNWGKAKFVGSIEDLIKKRFDDVILRPVDSSGDTLQGCTSSGETWIEWRLRKSIDGEIDGYIKKAERNLEAFIKKTIDAKISEIKDKAIKHEVDSAFISILKQQ